MTTITAQTLHHLDPRTLLVDKNVRTDVRLDKDFLASVREYGVLVPVVGVLTAEGQVRVRYGQRRTLAAIEGERPTVPVYVAADEATDTQAEVERLVSQYAENEHRTGLSTVERMAVAEELFNLGVSAAQITKRTRMPRAEVDAALVTAGSDLARAAAARYDFLDLTQSAVVAEFEDDAEAVKALVTAARDGRFDHTAQRLRDARAERERREVVTTRLTDSGVTVIEAPKHSDQAKPLNTLLAVDGEVLTEDTHSQCPGHAAYVTTAYGYLDPTTGEPVEPEGDEDEDEDAEVDDDGEDDTDPEDDGAVWGAYFVARYVCTDPAAHGHVSRYSTYDDQPKRRDDMTDDEREAARAERRRVIENNKAWTSAETVRREWVERFVTRKTPPKGTAAFVACAVARDSEVITSSAGNTLAAEWLNVQPATYGRSAAILDLIAKATEARAQVLTLALALAGYEANTSRNDWRSPTTATTAYLRFLAANGYALADVERLACGEQPETDEQAA